MDISIEPCYRESEKLISLIFWHSNTGNVANVFGMSIVHVCSIAFYAYPRFWQEKERGPPPKHLFRIFWDADTVPESIFDFFENGAASCIKLVFRMVSKNRNVSAARKKVSI